LALTPDDPLVLTDVAERCQALGRWDEAYAALDRLTRSCADLRVRAALHLSAGRIAEQRLGDDERALPHYVRAQDLDARSPAVAALERVYLRRGAFVELTRLLVNEADLAADASVRAALLFKAGDLALARGGDVEHAVDLIARALGAQPGFAPALLALE